MNPRERVLKILLRILNNPGRYTRKQLAAHFGQSVDAVKKDTEIINSLAELNLFYQDPPYTCRIEANNKYSALDVFRPLTEEDRGLIFNALHRGLGSTKEANLLQSKIEGLYDFQQLGLRQLRHPAIEKINRLESAKAERRKVRLVRYRSNSNAIKDRVVEPFLINPELDTLQAYDYIREEARHFRLSRIERITLLEESWQHENRHLSRATDVFRIADNNQVLVKLRLNVQAYNVLLETYPMAASYTEPGADENQFIFQAKVNAGFLGLSNFIMGYASDVDVLGPESLQDDVRELVKRILMREGRLLL